MFEIRRHPTLGSRFDLAGLCDVKGLKTAVEVGTDRGLFAREFLRRWHGAMLWCVDSYEAYPEFPWDRSGDLALAVAVLGPHADRVRLIRARSAEVVTWFGRVLGFPLDIDFVYIDAAHTTVDALQDLEAWWPIVRPGGILAGHDFDERHTPGVVEAVTEFARKHDLLVSLTSDFNQPRSFVIEKEI